MSDPERPFVDIQLVKPLEIYAGKPPMASVRLFEPTGGQYVRHGEPRLLVRVAGNASYVIEQPAAIEGYLRGCIDHPEGELLLTRMCLADAIRTKMALFDFFLTAEATASSVSSTPSSSA